MGKSPVFIVGSPRSGTSALVHALQNVGYRGYLEGNFLPLISIIERIVDRHLDFYGRPHPQVLAAQVDRGLFNDRIADIFKEFTDRLNVGPLWFDKSGNVDMILAIPTLRRLWPDSVYLFAKRRAIENVVSRVRKFPAHDFEYHCADWAKNMAAWREVRQKIPADVYLEVDQQDLIRDTANVSARIAGFLRLNQHETRRLEKGIRFLRPQETARGSAERILSLDDLGWSEPQMAAFQRHCLPEMERYGYALGEEYFRST